MIPEQVPSEFVKKEFNRILELVSKTDPASDDYVSLLYHLERFSSIAPIINAMLQYSEETSDDSDYAIEESSDEEDIPCVETPKANVPSEDTKTESEPKEQWPPEDETPVDIIREDPTSEPPAAPKAEPIAESASEYTSSEVRKALGDLRNSKGVNIPQLLNQLVGVTSFAAIPEGKYADIMAYCKENS